MAHTVLCCHRCSRNGYKVLLANLQGTGNRAVWCLCHRFQSVVQQVEEKAAQSALIDGEGLWQQCGDVESNSRLLRLGADALQNGVDGWVRRVDLGQKLLQLLIQMAQIVMDGIHKSGV